MYKKIIVSLITFQSLLFAQHLEIKNKIDNVLSGIPASSGYSVLIYDPVSKDTIYQKNAFAIRKPASNTKLFTTGVALSTMGGDFEIPLSILSDDDKFSAGIVQGNLYIKGYGNSIITDNDIEKLAVRLKEMGIRKIEGKIIGDDSYFDSVYHRSDWIEDEYSSVPLPPVSAIVINRNRVSLRISPSSGELLPSCRTIAVVINTDVTKRKTSVTVRQLISPGKYQFIVSGKVRRNSSLTETVEIKDPALFAACLFKDRLLKNGIEVTGIADRGIAPESSTELAHKSVVLKDLIALINKHSDNYLAECLFKTLGANYSGKEGNAFYATQAVMSFINTRNISIKGSAIVDGSGLSHYNQITAASIVDLLKSIYFDKALYQDFYNSLSIMGVDGTLRNRLIGTPAANNMHGKTGTLRDVIALSGYMKDKNNKDLIISMIFEFERGSSFYYREKEDEIVDLLLR